MNQKQLTNSLTWQVRILGAVGSSMDREAMPLAWDLFSRLRNAVRSTEEKKADFIITDSRSHFEDLGKANRAGLFLSLTGDVELPLSEHPPGGTFLHGSLLHAVYHGHHQQKISRVCASFNGEHTALLDTVCNTFLQPQENSIEVKHQEGCLNSKYVVSNDFTHLALLLGRGQQGVVVTQKPYVPESDFFDSSFKIEGMAFWLA